MRSEHAQQRRFERKHKKNSSVRGDDVLDCDVAHHSHVNARLFPSLPFTCESLGASCFASHRRSDVLIEVSVSLSLSVSVWCCGRVVVVSRGVSCCVVLCLVVRCGVWCVVCPFKTPPCVRPKRLRVYRHHAHMLKHMCARCRHTRGRIGRTHGEEREESSSSASCFSSVKQVF